MDKPWLVFSDAQGGMLNITDTRSGAQKTIYPYPNRVGSVGDAMIGHKYRFNWNSPIALSRKNPAVAYFGGNVLFKSTNYGLKWDVISPDLTNNDPKKQQSSGGEIVTDNTAAEFHSTLLSIAPSPLDSNVIWTSSDDGMVYVTRDGGTSWTSTFANVPGLPPNAWLATIEASNFDVGTAYVTADRHQDDDYAPYVYMTTDFGKTWKSIRGDLPDKAWWTHVIREDTRNRNLLYVGTEAGIWASWDRGARWVSLRGDLPVTPVRDLQIHPRDNDLIVATHGRGLYIMDDVTALQQLETAEEGAENAILFDIRPAVRWNMWNKDGNLGQRRWAGDNPPNGAVISYFLKSQPAGEVNVEIADASGRPVRRFNRVMDEPGVSRIAWDGRYEAAAGGFGGRGGGGGGAAAGQAQDTSLAALRARRRAAAAADAAPGGGGSFFGGGGGVAALPGTYQVSLVVGGKKYTKPVTLRNDPRVEMTPAQVTAQYEAGLQLQGLGQRVARVIAGVDDMIAQLSNRQVTLLRNSRANTVVLVEIEGTIKDLRHFRDSVLARPLAGLGYRQYPRLREEVQTVTGMVTRPQWPMTDGEKLRSGELRVETDDAQARLDAIITNRVGKINELLKGTQHVITPVPRVQP